MGRSKETFNKKEVQKKKAKKRQDKEKKKLAKKEEESKGGLDSMIAYVDEYGRITDTPPEHERTKVKAKDIEIGVPKKSDMPEEDPVRRGVITYFNDSKGYGFIKDSETKESVFVHVNNVLEEIKEGNLVSFETEKGHKGLAAIKVKLIK